MTETSKWSVVYQGSKLFWRTRNTIDVTIVQHISLNITEIIAFEPSINVEAKRVYLNSKVLDAKLDQAEIDAKYSFAKQNNVPISTEFINSVVHRAIADFVLARLIISEFNREECRFEVNMEFRLSDRISVPSDNVGDQLVCERAAGLEPYETKNHKLLAPGEVDAAVKALEEEQRCLDETCTRAAVLEAEAHQPLSLKNRWRIPIVLIKMDKGKVLNAGDGQIWEAVSKNLKTKEDIERVTKVTGHSVTSSAQQAAKKALKSTRSCHSSPPSTYRKPVDSPVRSSAPTPRSISRTSSRLLADTATSQSRAQCAAEDNSAVRKVVHGKKPMKRGHSKRQLRANSRPASPRDADDSIDVDPEADHANEIKTRGGFLDQVATNISLLTASISSSSFKRSGLVSAETDTRSENPGDNGDSSFVGSSAQLSAAPKKRRSYFGALLSKMMRADSGPQVEAVPAVDSAPSSQAASAAGEVAVLEPVRKPKPTGVSSWLSWGQGRVGSTKVVPVTLVEYVAAEFAAE